MWRGYFKDHQLDPVRLGDGDGKFKRTSAGHPKSAGWRGSTSAVLAVESKSVVAGGGSQLRLLGLADRRCRIDHVGEVP
jgi:hypothetical protein